MGRRPGGSQIISQQGDLDAKLLIEQIDPLDFALQNRRLRDPPGLGLGGGLVDRRVVKFGLHSEIFVHQVGDLGL